MTKTELRKAVGRGTFTVKELAAAIERTHPIASKRVKALVEAGAVEVVGKTETGQRGRPATQYKVVAGK